MSEPIRIAVDPTNPGQFFACCGLLELADRMWSGAEGWFLKRDPKHQSVPVAVCERPEVEEKFDGWQFCLASDGNLLQIITELKQSPLSICAEEGEPSIHPVKLESFNLKLNWWIREDWSRFKDKPQKDRVGLMKTDLKFWAGNQSSGQIVRNLQKAITRPNPLQDVDYFEPSELVSSRFGLDSGPAWTALDVGFSINEHPIRVKASAAIELLAAIGLQRCRPRIHDKGIDYATWIIRLSPTVLAASVCGEIANISGRRYRTRIIDRSSYAAFDRAHPLQGDFRE